MMNSSRDKFLVSVRQAVRASIPPGAAVKIPNRDRIGYQGGGSDPVACFRDEFTKAGGFFHPAPSPDSAARKVLQILQQQSAKRVLVSPGPLLDRLSLPSLLKEAGVEMMSVAGSSRDQFFAAEIAISGVDFLVAETGTIVMNSRPEQPRSLSLLPPVHIAVAEPAQIIPDLFDLFEGAMLSPARTNPGSAAAPTAGESMPPHQKPISLPSCISLITGPSKTGDIELRLVTGVHGPGEIHLVFIAR